MKCFTYTSSLELYSLRAPAECHLLALLLWILTCARVPLVQRHRRQQQEELQLQRLVLPLAVTVLAVAGEQRRQLLPTSQVGCLAFCHCRSHVIEGRALYMQNLVECIYSLVLKRSTFCCWSFYSELLRDESAWSWHRYVYPSSLS